MGRTITPKYRIELPCIDFGQRKRVIHSFAWDCKRDGKPSVKNGLRFMQGYNDSYKTGGSNEHLKNMFSDYLDFKIIEQKGNILIASYKAAMFTVIN